MRRLLSFLTAILAIFSPVVSLGELVINEFMQGNVQTVMDDTMQFPDSWIELYNDSSEELNAGDYSISISGNTETAWSLPAVTIAPYSHILLYCDKLSNAFHTNFILETGSNGSIFLFNNQAEIIDRITPIDKMPCSDVSFGRVSDGSPQFGYQLNPTPGSSNTGGIAYSAKPLPDPEFSVPGMVCSKSVLLDLTVPPGCPAGTVLRYTLDCSEVTSDSPIYNGNPILISNTTVVKARLFHPDRLSRPTKTNSYIFHHTDKEIPILSIVSDPINFNDPESGIYAGNNYFNDWRRPVNVEFFESFDTEAIINQIGETRISGHSSRQYHNKPFVIYAGKQFGNKRFKHEFFSEDKPGINTFKSLTVRNGGDDFYQCHMRDAVIQRSAGPYIDADWQGARVVAVYRNGEWVGVMNLRERGNKANIQSNYDGLEDIDMIENWTILKEGDHIAFNRLVKMIDNPESTFEEFSNMMDINQFVDNQFVYLYFNNCDYPSNNIIHWRPRTPEGKWRLIMKDADHGIGLIDKANDEFSGTPSFQTINWLYDSEYPGIFWGHNEKYTRCFRRLMNFPEVSEPFFDRGFVALGTFLRADKVLDIIDEFDEDMSGEIDKYRLKYSINKYGTYEENLEYMKNWIVERSEFFPFHFTEYYDLGELINLEIGKYDMSSYVISINDIPLQTDTFKGYFPKKRIRSIFAKSKNVDDDVLGWKISMFESSDDTFPSKVETIGGQYLIPDFAEYDVVKIDPIFDNTNVSLIIDDMNQTVQYFDISGVRCDPDNLQPGLYIKKQGSKSTKVLIK